MHTERMIAHYHNTFAQLHKQFKWTNKAVLMASAAIYTMKSKTFDMTTYKQTAESIKDYAGLFSPMRSHPRFTTAAIMAVDFDNPVQHIPHMFAIYDNLIQRFKRGNFTYIAATIILTNAKTIPQEEIISKAKIIYDTMKKGHPFLTGTSNYPLATILAYENREDMGERMEYFYQKLNDNRFHKGNNLQFLSHILTLAHEENDNVLVSRMVEVSDAFKQVGIKQKPAYYPVMGMLALLPSDEVNLEDIADMYKQLNQLKHFKWQKDLNVMMAASLFVSRKLERSNIAQTSIYTAVESIIQAQQATMIAAMAGGTAAYSGTSGGN